VCLDLVVERTKRIGQPERAAVVAKLFAEEALANNELSYQRLASRNVAILHCCQGINLYLPCHAVQHSRNVHTHHLDPRATDRNESTLGNAFLDSLKQLWMILLQPVVLLCLRAGKLVLWILVHQAQLRCPASSTFAPGLSIWPQPRYNHR
jgi:hypothetical protein